MDSFKEGYAKKFESKNQDEIGQDATCELCGFSVNITDFRTAEALEAYCCGSGNDEGFCQHCQDKINRPQRDDRNRYQGKPIEDTGAGLYFLIASDPPYAGLVWRQVPDYWTIEDVKGADLDGAVVLSEQDLS